MSKIILINGRKRSGKDFTAKIIQEYLNTKGKTSEIMSFADPLKEILSESLNITIADFNKWKNTSEKIIVQNMEITDFRKLIQNFGTEAMKRQFGESVWADILRIKANKSECDFVIVPDFRFIVEEISDITIKIENKNIDNIDIHRSENELNNYEFKYIIENDGFSDITKQVYKIVDDILCS